MAKPVTTPSLSVRLDLPGGSRFGPGKAGLLEAINATGSISSAARALEMSYPKASRLVGEMNGQFRTPLISTHQGGAIRGGATLTANGLEILRLYTAIVDTALSKNQLALNTFAEHSQRKDAKK